MAKSGVLLRHSACGACKLMRLRHLGLAFFWACSMLTYRTSILIVGSVDTPELQTIVAVAAFLANMTTLFIVASNVESRAQLAEKMPGALFCAAIMLGMALIAAAGHLPNQTTAIVLLIVGALLTGVGYGFFWGSWAEALGRMHPTCSAQYTPMAFLLTTALFLAISLASTRLGVSALALMMPLPIISLICLKRCMTEAPSAILAEPPSRERSDRHLKALSSLIALIMAAIVLSLLFGFMWAITVFSVRSVNEAHLLPQFVNLAAAFLMVAFVLATRRHVNLALAYHVVIPVCMVLFALVPVAWDISPIMFNAVMSACYGIFDVILWYSVASAAYDYRVSGFVIGGIVRAVSLMARVIGIGIGYLVMLIPGEPPLMYVCISVAAMYLMAMIAFMHWSAKRHPTTERAEVAGQEESLPTSENASNATCRHDPHESELERSTEAPLPMAHGRSESSRNDDAQASRAEKDNRCLDAIASDYGLTRREAEVLPYLAKGRSAKVTAAALYVSESTVRTHNRRIFEKLNVHSKQELIDLVDRYF